MSKAVISDDENEFELGEDNMEPHEEDAVVDQDGGDEDEDEGPDEYEKDGFIVDDVDEEEEEQDEEEEERQKKKKKIRKRKKKEYVLDEDDYELLQDNNMIAPRRHGKLKRLKKAQGDDLGPPVLEDIAEEDEEPAEDDEEEDIAGFIVDEDDDDGVAVRRKKLMEETSRQAPGVCSSALEEARAIFGDVDELLELHKKSLDPSEWKESRLEDEVEPIVLSEKYMTEKDNRIREVDVPERIQVYEESTGFLALDDEKSIDDESIWIFNQLARRDSISRDDIIGFLKLHHVQKLDVPFIAMYRKEKCLSILKDPEHMDMDDQRLKWHKVLWSIQDLHRKWLLLQKRKSSLQSYYEKRFDEESKRVYDEARLSLNQQLLESIVKSLKGAESEREVDDVATKFNLHFPAGEIGVDQGKYKRPKRKSMYSICSKAGLWEVASKFGYTSEQFGLQLSLEKMRMDEVEDAKETPEELASNFRCATFKTPQEVLKGARHMAAVEISCEPCVRKYVRSNYLDMVEVSTKPTPDGSTAIDALHQFAGVKWLQRKPLNKFEDAQWLLIQKAEEEKLLQVTIKLPEDKLNKLMSDFNEYYLSDGVSKSAQLWNEQRKSILQDALLNFLLPSMEKEARLLLTSRAKSWLLMEYGKVLWNKVSTRPYQSQENDMSSEDEAAPRVMACCWSPGNGKPATTFVMLDSSGEVLEVLHTGSLTLRSQKIKDQDQEHVLKLITDHQPHVAVLGEAVSLTCLRRDMDMHGLSMVYGYESLARLYEKSRILSDQLPAQSGIVKHAVALGRYLQNPLAMVATLCGPGREILSWKLHPLDNLLTPDEKYAMIEQVMVDVTNQVGLDINLAIRHEWLFAPLQFISGLGPRKAAFLQRSLVRSGAIFIRKDLWTAHGLSQKVFVNAAGFLRVRRSGLAASSSQYIDLLDDTRVHPESYNLAEQLAKVVVYEVDGGNDDAMGMAIEHVRDRPAYLKSLDVEAYAKSKELENKIQTLCDIRRELIQGFQDWRKKYEEQSQYEDTLAEGRTVQNLDTYYHEDRRSSTLQTEQEKAKKQFKPRMIVHPRFQNITTDEAIKLLSDTDPGESIIRPSSRGPWYLTLTLKVYDGVYAHRDILEGGKEHKGIGTSLLSIGKTLKIGEDTYEDLDEVMYRYVDPLVCNLKAMLNHRKFRQGTKAEVDELLKIEKSEFPMKIVYCFGISHEHPGSFILTYIRSTNPHHEYVGLYPKGFTFRKMKFESINDLVVYFQKHVN